MHGDTAHAPTLRKLLLLTLCIVLMAAFGLSRYGGSHGLDIAETLDRRFSSYYDARYDVCLTQSNGPSEVHPVIAEVPLAEIFQAPYSASF